MATIEAHVRKHAAGKKKITCQDIKYIRVFMTDSLEYTVKNTHKTGQL